ncbi:hypothetical protein DNH61_25725 [Paenibacillus sambharensis]|uniref:HTH merR-type domain-containing protein n=2 Tax=Paenibacillus sambharensis TaxID=1803190 RepID=A0A2W1L1Y2_9BACL|nr:hypothetical protein DNH61_25725 [Paenibacillus sambharensis]
MGMQEFISIGEASQLLGLSIDTIRYYEQIGLLPPIKRRESGYRVLDPVDLLHLKGISYLRQCGISTDKIKQLFQNPATKEAVIQEAIQSLEEKIKSLEAAKNILKEVQVELQNFDKGLQKYTYETLDGYFSPLKPEDVSLKMYLESEDMAWLIPLDANGLEVIQGRLTPEKPVEGFELNNLMFVSRNLEFESQKDIESEIYNLIHFANEKGHLMKDRVMLMVYNKSSCFTGKALAGKLLMEIEKEKGHD